MGPRICISLGSKLGHQIFPVLELVSPGPLPPPHRRPLCACPSTALLSIFPTHIGEPSHTVLWTDHATACPASLPSLFIGYSFRVARFQEGIVHSQPAGWPLAAPREELTASGRGRKCRPQGPLSVEVGQARSNCPAPGQSWVIVINGDEEDKQAPDCQKLGFRGQAPAAGQRKGLRERGQRGGHTPI